MAWTGQLPFPTSGQWRMVVRSPLRRSPPKVGFLLYLTVTCLVTYLHQSGLVCVVILGDSLMVLQVLRKIQKKSFPRR
jgi:hypothetical protein